MKFSSPPAAACFGRIGRVQWEHDGVSDDHRDDGQRERRDQEPAALAELQQLRADEADRSVPWRGHAASPNRVVISRNRCSSDARAGSSRWTATPASTRRRLMSAAAAAPRRRVEPGVDPGVVALGRSDGDVRAEDGQVLLDVARVDQERRLCAGANVADRPLPDDLAAVDDRERVDDLLDLVEQVRREETVRPRRRVRGSCRGTPGSPPGRGRSSARRGSATRGRRGGCARRRAAAACRASSS